MLQSCQPGLLVSPAIDLLLSVDSSIRRYALGSVTRKASPIDPKLVDTVASAFAMKSKICCTFVSLMLAAVTLQGSVAQNRNASKAVSSKPKTASVKTAPTPPLISALEQAKEAVLTSPTFSTHLKNH